VVVVTLAGACANACASAGTGGAQATANPPLRAPGDTTGLIPAGFGSLRQDDIAIHLSNQGITVRAIPLADNFIRTLAPDSHRALLAIRDSRRAAVDSVRRRAGLQSVSVWYLTFVSIQQGESRFAPYDVSMTGQSRDFRPLDLIPITPGFSEQRLTQRQQATALYVFDGALDPNQPLTMTVGTQTGSDWRSVLQRVESERARIRSRSGSGREPRGDS
jgi:hypothetical protein